MGGRIVASAIVSDRRQPDGRRQILERHTDRDGLSVPVRYTALADVDALARLAEHALQLTELRSLAFLEQAELALMRKRRALALLPIDDAVLADILLIPIFDIDEARAQLRDDSTLDVFGDL
jgi:hypothetical protein